MTAEFIVAVHAIVFLNHKKEYLTSDEIAENVCTNPARVRKVLLKLKGAGLVDAKGGKDGGYGFILSADKVTLLDIFNAVGTSIVKVNWRSGSADMQCPIASGMAPIMDGVFVGINNCCKASLSQTSIYDIDKKIFIKE